MPTPGHIEFINRNRDVIREPILIIASKIYDFDRERLQDHLKRWGFHDFRGIDLMPGEGVDETIDVTDSTSEFWGRYQNHYQTVFCLELWTYVRQPFVAANLITGVIRPQGSLFLSECPTRKVSRMPVDLWRFTLSGLHNLFPSFDFDHDRTSMFYTRSKEANPLVEYQEDLPEILSDHRHPDENALGFFLRRLHRRFFAKGIFRLSRFLPETTVCTVGRKR